MHVKRFAEISESVATHKSVKPEKLPHCAEMEARGYRVAEIGGIKYAFHKDYEADDVIYWLGKNTPEYRYGQQYIATPDVTADKKNNPFYAIYCKCDPSPTDEQKKIIAKREKENQKRIEDVQKEIRGAVKEEQKKKKKNESLVVEKKNKKGKCCKGVEYGKFKGKTYTGKIISHVPGEKIRYI